jgi:hypothetical protein
MAFLLVEPDFRLRRTRGQVRVQFSGSSAKSVAKAGIASGDEVILSLDGVEWVQDETPFATPGRGVEFDLKFTERLLLQVSSSKTTRDTFANFTFQFRQEDCQEINLIDIDHPTPEPEARSHDRIPSQETAASPPTTANSAVNSARPSPITKNGDEWSSPAFIKRARTSYGSLFDKEYDPFAEEDGTRRGKGRKRTRLSSTWRYESRSPSLEVEEESTLDTSPEPAARPTPMMTDEGCQTIGLEDGDAAEVLAGFHKQATSVGSSSYTQVNGTMASRAQAASVAEIDLEFHENPTDLPMIQTQLHSVETKLPDQEAQSEAASRNIPSSPRLQPVPSDALPLVSPLITNQFGAFLGMGGAQGIASQVPTFNEQVPTPVSELALPAADNEHEDLYGASPAAIHGQAHMDELNSFQDPSVVMNILEEVSMMQSQLSSEDQYGHWQSVTAQWSRGGSPRKTPGEVKGQGQEDGFYNEEHQDDTSFPENGLPLPKEDKQNFQQHLDLKQGNHGLPLDATWETRSTAYPDLLEHDNEFDSSHVVQQTLHPRGVAMSPSASAQIDLTESSDEEEAEERNEGDVPLEAAVDEEDYEPSNISEEGFVGQQNIENERIRGRLDGYRSFRENSSEDEEEGSIEDEFSHDNQLQQDLHVSNEDASQNSQDEDEFYEEDVYEDESVEDGQHYQRYPPDFDPEEVDFDEEDEESYDEDVEDGEQHQGQRAPVVIDLLSSDEEDGGETVVPNPASERATHPRSKEVDSLHSLEEEQIESDEDTDANEEMGAEQNLLPESPTQVFGQSSTKQVNGEDNDERFAVEDEDLINAEQEDNLPPTGDEDSMEDAASGLRNRIKIPADIDQDTELVQPDETLVNEEPGGASTEDEQAMEGVELETLPEEPLREKHALQVEGNGDTSQSEEKVQDASALIVETFSEQQITVVLEEPPSLFARMFNLDGANDERLPSLYPALPRDENITSVTEVSLPEKAENVEIVKQPIQMSKSGQDVSERTVEVEVVEKFVAVEDSDDVEVSGDVAKLHTEIAQEASPVASQPPSEDNGQLPTPEATQLSLMKESSKISISSVRAQEDSSVPLGSTPDEPTIDPALKDAPQPMEEDSNILLKDTAANVETGNIGTEAIDENTAKIGLEENDIESARDEKVARVVIEAHNTRSRTRQRNGSLEPVAHEEIQSLEEVVRVSPRRSHRRGKSTSSNAESPLTKVPTTPTKPSTKVRLDKPVSARTDRSSSVILDERTTPKGHDASIELAMSALDSPVKQQHDLRSKEPGMDRKLKLTRALRTDLSEFTSLKMLRYHLTQKLDVLGVATTTPHDPERAKGGPRHYQIIFNITDQSIIPGGSQPVAEVQVFRPYKDALPIVKVGDGILLRNFTVIAVKNRGFSLQSNDASSWAVFRGDEEEVEMRGPPVEFGEAEKNYIAMLRSWYIDLDSKAMEKINRANGDQGQASAAKGIRKVV